MVRNWLVAGAAMAVVSACSPEVPNSAPVNPIEPYQVTTERTPETRRATRDAQLEGVIETTPGATGAPPSSTQPVVGLTAADLRNAGIGARGELTTGPSPAPVATTATSVAVGSASASRAATPADAGAPLSAIPSTTLVQPAVTPQASAAPSRSVDAGSDIVAFALSTEHAVGVSQYSRGVTMPGKADRACKRYTSPDVAQRAFLDAGGPTRDRLGLDPDGDGFACAWTPEPFRAAVRG